MLRARGVSLWMWVHGWFQSSFGSVSEQLALSVSELNIITDHAGGQIRVLPGA